MDEFGIRNNEDEIVAKSYETGNERCEINFLVQHKLVRMEKQKINYLCNNRQKRINT